MPTEELFVKGVKPSKGENLLVLNTPLQETCLHSEYIKIMLQSATIKTV